MKVVFKYHVKRVQVQTIELPKNAIFRHFAVQNNELWAWFEIPADHVMKLGPVEERHFELSGTGEWIPDPLLYLGTVNDGHFVWHLYEVV